jgi:hypothetical protein
MGGLGWGKGSGLRVILQKKNGRIKDKTMQAERFEFVNSHSQEVNIQSFAETQKPWIGDLHIKKHQQEYFIEVISLNNWSDSCRIIAIGDNGNILSFLMDEGVSPYFLPYSVVEAIAILGIANGFPSII